jgi:chaperonin GroES
MFQEMNIKPLNDRVLVLRIEEEQKTSGGIIIPDTAKEKPQEGKVIAVGPGKFDENGKRIPVDVKKNDRVLFGKYAGSEIKLDGVEHIIMRVDDIIAILEK